MTVWKKALLRNSVNGLLPDKILWRKKARTQKHIRQKYRARVTEMLKERLKSGRIGEIIDRSALDAVLSGDDKTWFGQLMSTPQLIAWLIQFDEWMSRYDVVFER